MKYSHIRCPSDCQHGHLTNFSESHHKTQRAGPALWAADCGLLFSCFFYLLLFILKSATSVPGYSPQWNVRTLVMRGAFRQLPLIDRHIQLPFRPLLYSTPPRASPWQSKPTCQSAALIVHWDGFHFNASLSPHVGYTGEAHPVREHASGRFVNLHWNNRMRGASKSWRAACECVREIFLKIYMRFGLIVAATVFHSHIKSAEGYSIKIAIIDFIDHMVLSCIFICKKIHK